MVELFHKDAYLHRSVARLPRWVLWHPTAEDVVVLNVDGSSLQNPGPSGFGGVLHSGQGEWIVGFHDYLGNTDILHAELMALLRGLQLAWDRDFRDILVYSDSSLAFRLVSQLCSQFHVYVAMVMQL